MMRNKANFIQSQSCEKEEKTIHEGKLNKTAFWLHTEIDVLR